MIRNKAVILPKIIVVVIVTVVLIRIVDFIRVEMPFGPKAEGIQVYAQIDPISYVIPYERGNYYQEGNNFYIFLEFHSNKSLFSNSWEYMNIYIHGYGNLTAEDIAPVQIKAFMEHSTHDATIGGLDTLYFKIRHGKGNGNYITGYFITRDTWSRSLGAKQISIDIKDIPMENTISTDVLCSYNPEFWAEQKISSSMAKEPIEVPQWMNHFIELCSRKDKK